MNCDREVASSIFGLGYFAARPTQPFILPGRLMSSSLCKWVTEETARCTRGGQWPHLPTQDLRNGYEQRAPTNQR